jgi:hypothetical protein
MWAKAGFYPRGRFQNAPPNNTAPTAIAAHARPTQKLSAKLIPCEPKRYAAAKQASEGSISSVRKRNRIGP